VTGVVFVIALVGSIIYLVYAITVRDASQIPLLASGAAVLGLVFGAFSIIGLVATWRSSVHGRDGRAFGHALVVTLLGEALLHARELNAAQKTALRALEVAQRSGERGNEAWAYCLLGNVAKAHGRWKEAKAHYDGALKIACSLAMAPVRARCSVELK